MAGTNPLSKMPRLVVGPPPLAGQVVSPPPLGVGMSVGSSPSAVSTAAAPAAPTRSRLLVSTHGNDGHEVVIRTLVGEYNPKGDNHGKLYYQKVGDRTSADFVEVFMYYWDGRDGPAFEGWWFGSELGGSQVWAQSKELNGTCGPSSGWKIPWDGPVRQTLVVAPMAQSAGGDPSGKVNQLAAQLQSALQTCNTVMQEARTTANNSEDPAAISYAEETLQAQAQALSDMHKNLVDAQKGASMEAHKLIVQLATQLRASQNTVNTTLANFRALKGKAHQNAANRDLEAKDLATWQPILEEVTQKANAVEDSLEKAKIAAEMIAVAGEDAEAAKSAVEQTESLAKLCQSAIGEARIIVNTKIMVARRFTATSVREDAVAKLGEIQIMVQEAQNKLNPLKACRAQYQHRLVAQRLVAEVLDKLTLAEVGIDRAEELAAPLLGGGSISEQFATAQQALEKAQSSLNNCINYIEAKKRQAVQTGKEELEKLEQRAQAGLGRLQKLKESRREADERVISDKLVEEALKKLKTVQETVAKAADAENPFMLGCEELPLDDTIRYVAACDKEATTAQTACSIARMFIATKLVEVKRFGQIASQHASQKLKEYQEELEASTKRLNTLKSNNAERKQRALLQECQALVSKAEALSHKVKEAASPIASEELLAELTVQDVKDAIDAVSRAEAEALGSLAEARKFLTTRQIEAKGKDIGGGSAELSADLIKLQTRLSAAQAEVTKSKKLTGTAEQRQAKKRVIEEANNKLKMAEEKVELATTRIASLDETPAEETDEASSSNAVKEAESAAGEAQSAMKVFSRYLEAQSRGTFSEELTKLEPRRKEAEQRLAEATAVMRERSGKVMMRGMLAEAGQRVQACEEAVSAAKDAEMPFMKGDEDLPAEKAMEIMAELEKAAQAAHATAGSCKTFLAMKRLAAKRLSEPLATSATEEIAKLQERLDKSAASLGDLKKAMGERKANTMRKEARSRVEGIEKLLEASVGTTKVLEGDFYREGDDIEKEAEAVKAACEEAGNAQQTAQDAIEEVHGFLSMKRKDSKAASDTGFVTEIDEMFVKLKASQEALDKLKEELRDHEHRFVANRLSKDAVDMIERLEAKLKSTEEATEPLTSEARKEDFTSEIFLSHIVELLKESLQRTEKTPKELFVQMGAENDVLGEEAFVAYLKELPEVTSAKDLAFSEELLRAVFRHLAGSAEEGAKAKEVDFLEHFVVRFICLQVVSMTDTLVVKGSKTVRKLQLNEVVEAIEEPEKDDGLGLMRVKVKAAKDSKEGYVTLAGNQGTKFLDRYSAQAASQRKVEDVMAAMQEEIAKANTYIEKKNVNLSNVRSGPLAEYKQELQKLKPRASAVQSTYGQMKKKVADAHKRQSECVEVERRKQKEAQEKQIATAMLEECETLEREVDGKLEQVTKEAEELTGGADAEAKRDVTSLSSQDVVQKLLGREDPVQAITALEASLEQLLVASSSAVDKVKEKLDGLSSSAGSQGPLASLRGQLSKMKAKLGGVDGKVKKLNSSIAQARQQMSKDACTLVFTTLREHVQKQAISIDEVVKELAGTEQDISAESLRGYIEKVPGSSLKKSMLDLAMARYDSGISNFNFRAQLQEYYKCVKDIAMTTVFSVKESKNVRRLDAGEVVEVLEPAVQDEKIKASRVRCRAVCDHKEGWVTLQGNQGTPFLTRCAKPWYCCNEEVPLSESSAADAPEVRKLLPGEVLEVLEGPRKEPAVERQRGRGKALKDNTAGWVTIQDSKGVQFMQLAKLLVCRQQTALTTEFDIAEGKHMTKLAAGEVLERLEDDKKDSTKNLTRAKVKTMRTGKEGWVTLEGNQGTKYVEETAKHYTCLKPVQLEGPVLTAPDGAEKRQLEVGEIFELSEGVKTETIHGVERVRGRCFGPSGAEGWFPLTRKNVQQWAPRYKCLTSTVLHDKLEIAAAKSVCRLSQGEELEALEAPEREVKTGVMRVHARSEKQNCAGWVTVKGNQGTVILQPILS